MTLNVINLTGNVSETNANVEYLNKMHKLYELIFISFFFLALLMPICRISLSQNMTLIDKEGKIKYYEGCWIETETVWL